LFFGRGIFCFVASKNATKSGNIFSSSSFVSIFLILAYSLLGKGGISRIMVLLFVCFLGHLFGLIRKGNLVVLMRCMVCSM